jgi:uncharacterized protein involved in exopolysaccharide biosynthesis
MATNLDSANIKLSSMDIRSGVVLHAAFASLFRRKLLVLVIVGTALVLAIIAVLIMPAGYTAQAYIRGEFSASEAVAKENDNKSAGSISLDLVRVIETQSRLLQSHQLARRVVQHLGLDRLQPRVSEGRWLPAEFYDAAKIPGDKEDIAATKLLHDLAVTSDPRAYLITVQYTAEDSELAVLITNAFVAELLRSTKLQALLQQRSAAQATLLDQLAKFGEKHPRVAEARMQLADTDDLLKEELSESPEAILQAAGENVTKAIATPSSPHPTFVIGLLLLVGFAIGIGGALWLERDRWWGAFSQY